ARALAIRERCLGTEHPSVATTLHNMAVLAKVQSRHTGAAGLNAKALAILEPVFGPGHPHAALRRPGVVGGVCPMALSFSPSGRLRKLWGGPPGPQPAPWPAFRAPSEIDCKARAGPGGPARTRGSAPLNFHGTSARLKPNATLFRSSMTVFPRLFRLSR